MRMITKATWAGPVLLATTCAGAGSGLLSPAGTHCGRQQEPVGFAPANLPA